jgi:hypothetical protein
MNYSMDGRMNRRQAIEGGLTLGIGLLLAGGGLGGCQARPRWQPLSQDELEGPPRMPLAEARPRPEPIPMPAAPTGVLARRDWASTGPILALANPMGPILRITIHHDGMAPVALRSRGDVAHRLEFIRRSHANRGWADIGYHYAIDPEGRIWECRPVRLQGAHVKDHNENNLGIVVLGNFDEQVPTAAALTSLDNFVSDRMRAFRLPISRVHTHQEFTPTACPGRNLQGYMVATRSPRGRMVSA